MHYSFEWNDAAASSYSPWFDVRNVKNRTIEVLHAGTPDGTITVRGHLAETDANPADGAGHILAGPITTNTIVAIDTYYCRRIQFQRSGGGVVGATVRFNGVKHFAD
jgi:hypothetical protein